VIEIEDVHANPPVRRCLNVDAIQDVSAAGEDRTIILMRNGSIHHLDMPYKAFKARLDLLLNRILRLEISS
jgi:hypothetical protein